jgi:hypothetical protein
MTLRIDITDMPVLDGDCKNDAIEALRSFEHTDSGVYRILFGSRGGIEEVERLGSLEDVSYVDIPTVREITDQMVLEADDDDNASYVQEYVDEFYHIEKDLYTGELMFTYTEEECDVYVKVATLQ